MNRYLDWKHCTFTVVDIETLGLDKVTGSVIVSIGFATLKNSLLTRCGEFVLDTNHEENTGFIRDEGTLNWHSKLPTETFEINFRRHEMKVSPSTAIQSFCDYIEDLNESEEMHFLVGNAPDFDFGMIECYCKKLDIDAPWKYFQLLDYRTLASAFGYTSETKKKANSFASKLTQQYPHNALFDAVYEAFVWVSFLEKLGKLPEPELKPENQPKSC